LAVPTPGERIRGNSIRKPEIFLSLGGAWAKSNMSICLPLQLGEVYDRNPASKDDEGRDELQGSGRGFKSGGPYSLILSETPSPKLIPGKVTSRTINGGACPVLKGSWCIELYEIRGLSWDGNRVLKRKTW